jgi:lipopolysaccharide transport system permease protein
MTTDSLPEPLEEDARATAPRPWVENRPSKGWFPRLDPRELWEYRELALFLAVKKLQIRYKQTVLGLAWAVLQPLVAMALFSALFGRLAGLPSDGLPYPVFVFAGLASWVYFSSAVNNAAESLVTDEALVTKVYFPRILAPLASILPGLVDLAVSLVVIAVLMAIYSVAPGPELVFLPFWIFAAVFVAFGAGAWLAALNVLYRDVRIVLAFLLQVWLFASPVIFPSSLVGGTASWFFHINPVAGVIDGFRWSLIGTPAPGPEALVSLAVAVVLVITGVIYFQRVERRFADQI